MHQQYRIVLALIGVFISPDALVWTIHGLIFDDSLAFRCGVVIVTAMIAGVVALLNLTSNGSR
ncbi:DUF2964 family protein [Paraburkholderia franconis]|uniref:DUF2964 family protein n=1 Tax=Paraburkholderia franconis TaxID=2654983 RepID=UPI00128AF2AE|nr:DUF2964 family protein [Paraburkholderia franconis]